MLACQFIHTFIARTCTAGTVYDRAFFKSHSFETETIYFCPPSELKTNPVPSDHGRVVLPALAAR